MIYLDYPGPMFRGEGYRAFCERYGIDVDVSRFAQAVASAAPLLDDPEDPAYNAEIFVKYTRHIIEQMGGRGERLDHCAREIYGEWAACQHFELYEDVWAMPPLDRRGCFRIGLFRTTSLPRVVPAIRAAGFDSRRLFFAGPWLRKPIQLFKRRFSSDVAGVRSAMGGIREPASRRVRSGMRAVLLHRGDGPHPRVGNGVGRRPPCPFPAASGFILSLGHGEKRVKSQSDLARCHAMCGRPAGAMYVKTVCRRRWVLNRPKPG